MLRGNLQWGSATSSPSSPSVTFTVLGETILQVHQVHKLWRSQFSVRPFYKFIRLTKCHDLQSPTLESPIEWCTLISTASPTSATMADLHCTLLKLHHSAVNLHSLATILWLCYPTCDRVIMLPDVWSCNYATNLQPCCRCDYAC